MRNLTAHRVLVLCAVGWAAAFAVTVAPASARSISHISAPAFGPNGSSSAPSTPQAQIQSTRNAIATQQVPNQFGTQRYAILFEPGTYGSAANPLIFQVGYYTQVAGLGAKPGDVVIDG